jgi:methyltransferase family protein
MAARGVVNTDGLQNVEFEISDFESASVEPGSYDLVYSAQAWHWITPELRYGLARRALRQGGALAVFWNRTDWARSELRTELDAAYKITGVYMRENGPMYPGVESSPIDLGDDWLEEVAGADGLGDAQTHVYEWTCEYDADAYVKLISTHSDHIVLADDIRSRLFAAIHQAIEGHGGSFAMQYVSVLCLAHSDEMS